LGKHYKGKEANVSICEQALGNKWMAVVCLCGHCKRQQK